MAKIVLFGTNKLAELMHFYFVHDSSHEVVAFSVDEKYMKEREFRGLPIVPFEEVEKKYNPADYQMFVAIGYKKLNSLRTEKYLAAKAKGYRMANYVSTKAAAWGDTRYGDNCCVMENQIIQPTVQIGNNVIIWGGNHMGHNVVIGDHSFVASHVIISGGVKVGQYCFLGINATIRDNVHIGDRSIIGAGALILNDVKEKSVYIAKETELYRLNSDQFERMMEISK